MGAPQPSGLRRVAASALAVTVVSLVLWVALAQLFPEAPPTAGETAVLVLVVMAGAAAVRAVAGRLRRAPRSTRSEARAAGEGDAASPER